MPISTRETPVNTRGKRLECKLRQLMGLRNNMRIQDLCDMTNLRRNTIAALYNDKATRIDTVTVAAICGALECNAGDLFVLVDEMPDDRTEYVPDEDGD